MNLWNICFIFLSLIFLFTRNVVRYIFDNLHLSPSPHLLVLIWHLIFQMSWKQERGFLPLSVALLSSSKLRSDVGHIKDIFMEIASSIEAIILSLLFCRSGVLSVTIIIKQRF